MALSSGRAYAALDGLRAWAVMMVFHVHFFGAWWQQGYGVPPGALRTALAVAHSGHLGVDLFFVLSGFIIEHTLRKRPLGFFAFLGRRYRRLLPAHLAALVPRLPAYVMGGSFAAIAWNVSLLQSLVAGCAIVNYVTWSLSYEMAWYALASLGFVAGRRRARWRSPAVVLAVIALVVASPLAAPALGRAGIELPIASRFVGFFFGYGVARLRYDAPALWARARPVLRHAGWPAVAAVFVIRYEWMRTPEAARAGQGFEWTFYLAADACFAVLVAHLIAGAGSLHRLLCTRPAQYLGRVSYSFYLVHGLYGIPLAARLLAGLGGGALFRMTVGYAAALALTTAMAAVLFHFFERPYFKSV